ncbi:hypothetical protein P691DRAFT_762840 [Macrolepiota fuliginosa MF-IS2]|uniref:Uncharacterized protein n=1 Tax=Macrolepiota fuliginosa MF-IS2 TaxID=1400762 RepID=A0A9P5X942_9AGAR|nr:hypothetical protein P691DRAFT_762840 [Macrolepiota fuliginosa MF-IS2]
MTNFNSLLPLFNSTNSTAAKRKHLGFTAKKAAPTCTLSLTSVSALPSGGDSLNLVPFPSTTTATTTTTMSTSVPFPSSSSSPPPTTTTTTIPIPAQTRTRVRQSSLLRRKRATACLAQPYLFPCTSEPGEDDIDPCSAQDQDQSAPTPPRKRARKASISCPSTSTSLQSSTLPSMSTSTRSTKPPSIHSLAISSSQRRGKGGSKKAVAELRFMCMLYRSVACVRLWREFEAASKVLAVPGGWEEEEMDVDVEVRPTGRLNGRGATTALDAQESLFISRLRSYLVFNEVNSAWLDLTPLSLEPTVGMDVDSDSAGLRESREANSGPSVAFPGSTPPLPFHPHMQYQLPIMTPEQAVASLMFRFRNRDRARGKPKPEASAPAPASVDDSINTNVKRRRSPLAGFDASWIPEGS